MQEPRIEHTRTHWRPGIHNRKPNQENKGGKKRAHSITSGAGTALQIGERIQELGDTIRANGIRIKRIQMKCQLQTRASLCSRWQDVPQVRPEVSRVGATKRRSIATEQMMLNAAPTTLRLSVTPSSSRRRHIDGDLAVRPRTQIMR
jgi:hypothetical protein